MTFCTGSAAASTVNYHSRQGDDTREEDGDVTVRFWVCSMDAYDEFKPIINKLWELTVNNVDSGVHFGDRARIEIMLDER